MFIERLGKSNYGKRSLLYGQGINDAPYVVEYKDVDGKRKKCPYYKKWEGMLKRCYCVKNYVNSPSYEGCTVVDAWKTFTVFKAWMLSQNWEEKALDKDLLNRNAKQYGPDTCLFLSKNLNNLLVLCESRRGVYPLGVSSAKFKGTIFYSAACCRYGKKTILGYYKTVEEAAAVYKATKLSYIAELAAA